jgi:hypothetical protein
VKLAFISAMATVGVFALGLVAPAQAATDGEIVKAALLAVHDDEASLSRYTAPGAKFVQATTEGKVQKAAPLKAADLHPFLTQCSLADWGKSRPEGWLMSWKCGPDFTMMFVKVTSGRISRILLEQPGPPWITDRPEPYPLFPQITFGDY